MCVDLALPKEGRLKVGEAKLLARGEVGEGRRGHPPSHLQRLFPSWFLDVIDVISSLRGLGWKFGQGLHFKQEHRPLVRRSFLRATALTALANWCAGDFLVSSLAILPGLGVPSGRSIYYEQLPPIPRYLLTFTITIATSMVIETHMTSLIASSHFLPSDFSVILPPYSPLFSITLGSQPHSMSSGESDGTNYYEGIFWLLVAYPENGSQEGWD